MPGGRRVAVTGLGVVAPAGIGASSYWDGLIGPPAPVGRTIVFDDWDGSPYFDGPKQARRADRVEQFALAAAGAAFDQVGGVDASQDELLAMAAGDYDVTVFQDSVGQGTGSIDTALRLIAGEKVDKKVYIPFVLVTPANMGDFLDKN